MTSAPQVPGVEVRGTWREPYAEVLTEDALALLARLHRRNDQGRRVVERRRRYRAIIGGFGI